MKRSTIASLATLIILFACFACTKAPKAKEESKTTVAPTAPAKTAAKKVDAKTKPGEAEEKKEITAGDSLKELLAEVKVQNSDFKTKSIADLVKSKKNILINVKPGCVFCESMLAVMSNKKIKTKAKMFFVLDSKHATGEDFKSKKDKFSKIKNAEWIYDFNNELVSALDVHSFPRFLVVDNNLKVLKVQTGLVMPENRESLKEKQFPEVLQILSNNTVKWINTIK